MKKKVKAFSFGVVFDIPIDTKFDFFVSESLLTLTYLQINIQKLSRTDPKIKRDNVLNVEEKRSSRSQMFFKIGILKNFSEQLFFIKHLWWLLLKKGIHNLTAFRFYMSHKLFKQVLGLFHGKILVTFDLLNF